VPLASSKKRREDEPTALATRSRCGVMGCFAHLGEVAALEIALEGDPVAPGLLEGQAEDLLELVGVVALAALVAPQPRDHLPGRWARRAT